MALSANTVWEVRTTGATTNGGGFALTGNTFDATLAGTNANTATPTVSSSNYSFVAGDAGAYLYISAGTNWIKGYYQIASVSAGAATLSQACASTASPTSGSWGVDYTQQASAQFSGTDLATNGAGTGVTSASHTFTQADVGNLIQISAGSGFTTGWYQILSVSAGTATIDRSAGLSLSNGTWALGGCLSSPSTLGGAMVTSNKAWIKNGTYSSASTFTFSAANGTPSNTVAFTEVIGYNAVRGDISPNVNAANRPVLQVTTSTNVFTGTNTGWMVRNIIFGGSGATPSTCINFPAGVGRAINCKTTSFGNNGISMGGTDCIAAFCEITGGTAGVGITTAARCVVYNNWVHDNVATGISANTEASVTNNVVSNNTGASHPGITAAGGCLILNNTVYGSGSHGISFTGTSVTDLCVSGNLLVNNSGFGFSATNSAYPARWEWDGNAYYNNSSGTRSNFDDTGTAIAVDISGPYTNTLDVILTADPFVNAAGNDFRLNQNPGGGAGCRGYGIPNTFPGLGQVAFNDMGAIQHQDPGFAG